MNLIQTTNLTKKYGQMLAVNSISLKVPKGKIYGFLGLNGAGKTTTMRMLLGMIKADHGSIRIFDQELPANSSLWKKVGYMIESTYAYPNLTVAENLAVFCRYHGISVKENVPHIMGMLQLERYAQTLAKNLSLGNLQRLGLAKALIHKPKLLILDEPTNGLDPAGIMEIRQLFRFLSERGTTIIISSHLLGEIAKIADLIGIIHRGSLIKELEAADLHHEIQRKLLLGTDDNQKARLLLKDKGLAISENENKELVISDTDCVSRPASIADFIVGQKLGLNKLYTFEEDLESYFMRTIQTYNHEGI